MNKEIQNQITQIEQLITDTKAFLKTWAKQIGHYHTQLKELSGQLAILKEQIIMKKNNKTPGGTK